MPRHTAQQGSACRRKGRMKPIVMPSARTACQLFCAAPVLITSQLQAICKAKGGGATQQACANRRASASAPGENGSVISLIKPVSNDYGLAHRTHPNNPANLIPAPVPSTR